MLRVYLPSVNRIVYFLLLYPYVLRNADLFCKTLYKPELPVSSSVQAKRAPTLLCTVNCSMGQNTSFSSQFLLKLQRN